jgi:hypothetical protein
MFKIIQQDNKLYTLKCYYYDSLRRCNVESYSGENLTEDALARMLQQRGTDKSTAINSFVVVKSGPRPAILTGEGAVEEE